MSQQVPDDHTESPATALARIKQLFRDSDWASPLVLQDTVVLVPLLGVFWLLLGPIGLAAWIAVTAAWAVFPAVVPVAIGELAIGSPSGTADTLLLIVTHAVLIGLLVRDGLKSGWNIATAGVCVALAAGLAVTVYLFVTRTSLLIAGGVLLCVIAVGVIGLSRLAPDTQSAQETLIEK